MKCLERASLADKTRGQSAVMHSKRHNGEKLKLALISHQVDCIAMAIDRFYLMSAEYRIS